MVLLAAAAAAACGVGGGTDAAAGAEAGPGSSSSSGGGAGSSGGPGPGSSGGPNDRCAGTTSRAERLPLDIYVMLDRSGSMADYTGTSNLSKWESVTSALSSFVGQPLDATSVGLQYFALPAAACSETRRCSRDADCGYCGGTCELGRCVSWGDGASCLAADYATPEVEIGPIATTAPPIRASMAKQQPSRNTPTSAALQGALDHTRAWAAAPEHAGHAVVALLATDGEPTSCEVGQDRIEAIAAEGLAASPSIRTFVIGVGDSLTNLNGIAKAGGTGAAYLVDAGGDVTAQFLRALNEIRAKAAGCSYAIPAAPAGQRLDYGRVNVEYRPGTGAALTFGKVADAAACGASTHAWHYQGPAAAPTGIVLCPGTCAAVEADLAATVQLVVGCVTAGEW